MFVVSISFFPFYQRVTSKGGEGGFFQSKIKRHAVKVTTVRMLPSKLVVEFSKYL